MIYGFRIYPWGLGIIPQTKFCILISPIQRNPKIKNELMAEHLFRFNIKLVSRTLDYPPSKDPSEVK